MFRYEFSLARNGAVDDHDYMLMLGSNIYRLIRTLHIGCGLSDKTSCNKRPVNSDLRGIESEFTLSGHHDACVAQKKIASEPTNTTFISCNYVL